MTSTSLFSITRYHRFHQVTSKILQAHSYAACWSRSLLFAVSCSDSRRKNHGSAFVTSRTGISYIQRTQLPSLETTLLKSFYKVKLTKVAQTDFFDDISTHAIRRSV